jgi:hypothetical protein
MRQSHIAHIQAKSFHHYRAFQSSIVDTFNQ